MDYCPRHSLVGTLIKVGIALFFWREIAVLVAIGVILVGPFLVGAAMGSLVGGAVSGDAMNPAGGFILMGGIVTTIAFWSWAALSGAVFGEETGEAQVAAFKTSLETTLANLAPRLSPQWDAQQFPPKIKVRGPSGQFVARRLKTYGEDWSVYVRIVETGLTTFGEYFGSAGHLELGRAKFPSYTAAVAQVTAWLGLPIPQGDEIVHSPPLEGGIVGPKNGVQPRGILADLGKP